MSRVNFKNMVRLMRPSSDKVVLEDIINALEDFRDDKISKNELLEFLCII